MEGRNIVRGKSRTRGFRGALALFVVLVGALALSGTAAAQEQITVIVDGQECTRDAYGGVIVCPDTEDRDFDPDVESTILGRPETPPEPPPEDTLPFTGADVTLFLITGAALVGTGMIVVRRTRAKNNEI
jgi:hypothetical protein